jgi:CDP-diacylglycerol--glycerol-3-phosphate 3-phosphatidyltransferase
VPDGQQPAVAPAVEPRGTPDRGRPATLTSFANLLAVARIAATPVVFVLAVVGWPSAGLSAALIFAAAAVTDFLDGRIARARRTVSPMGVFLDLAADKVLVAGAMVALVQVGLLAGWMAAAIVIREFVVQSIRQLAAVEDVVIGARDLGKAKTLLTLVGIWVLLLARDATTGGPLASLGIGTALAIAGGWLMLLATAVTVLSGLVYLVAAWPILTGAERRA